MKRKRYITLPENWDELTSDDWQEMLRIRHIVASTDHQWTVEDVRIESARALLKSRGVRQQLNNPQWLKLVADLAQSLTWLWSEEQGMLSLVYRSTENKMPCLTVGPNRHRQLLRGPESHGYDLTFGEFRQALQHLKAYENPAGDSEADRIGYRTTALCALAGLLYRPEADEDQRHRGLLRQPYDWDSLDDKIGRGRLMKPWQLWGIYAWFAYFCEALTTETFIIEKNGWQQRHDGTDLPHAGRDPRLRYRSRRRSHAAAHRHAEAAAGLLYASEAEKGKIVKR